MACHKHTSLRTRVWSILRSMLLHIVGPEIGPISGCNSSTMGPIEAHTIHIEPIVYKYQDSLSGCSRFVCWVASDGGAAARVHRPARAGPALPRSRLHRLLPSGALAPGGLPRAPRLVRAGAPSARPWLRPGKPVVGSCHLFVLILQWETSLFFPFILFPFFPHGALFGTAKLSREAASWFTVQDQG